MVINIFLAKRLASFKLIVQPTGNEILEKML